MNVEQIGTTVLLDGSGEVVVESDRYHVETETPAGRDHEWTFDALRIGCPSCKANTKAILDGDVYRCHCGYENDLDVTTQGTLMQASTLTVDDRVQAEAIER